MSDRSMSGTRIIFNLLAILFIAGVVVGPLSTVVVAAALPHATPSNASPPLGWNPSLFGASLAWALAIAILSSLLAFPAGWYLARRPRWWLILPLLLVPSYLASAGWGLMRAPGTFVGDWIERAAEGDNRWIPIWINRALAVLGLALWTAPLAAIVISSGVRRLSPSIEESLSLEPLSPAARLLHRVRLVRAELLISFALIVALMLGSAVPLHLAQIETYSTKLWLMLDQTAAADRWRIWVSAWPVLLTGAIAGGGLWKLIDHSVEPLDTPSPQSHPFGRAALYVLLAAGAILPLIFFAISIQHFSSFRNVWVVSRDAAGSSLTVMLGTGLLSFLLAGSIASGILHRTVAQLLSLSLAVTALVPGVLVGAALAAWISPTPEWLRDSPLSIILAHIARFGIIGVICGHLAARAETISEQDARRLDGGVGFKGWLVACLPWQWGILLSGPLCAAALSLHEIESTIMVTPPGMDTIARQMLQHLHFARTEELSVTSVALVLVGTTLAALAALLSRLGRPVQHPPASPGSISAS